MPPAGLSARAPQMLIMGQSQSSPMTPVGFAPRGSAAVGSAAGFYSDVCLFTLVLHGRRGVTREARPSPVRRLWRGGLSECEARHIQAGRLHKPRALSLRVTNDNK